MSLPLDLALLKDVILLLISGIACLYCVLLNRRLKGLNDLKSGVGASIVSLTEAIKETHKAAKSAQSSTVESTETLKDLLAQSSEASLRMEAETIALQRNVKRAIAVNAGLQVKVQTDLPDAIQRAQTTASNLLKVVADIEKYNATLDKPKSKKKSKNSSHKAVEAPKDNITNISHLKVVKKSAEILNAEKIDTVSLQTEVVTPEVRNEVRNEIKTEPKTEVKTEVAPSENADVESDALLTAELANHLDQETSKEANSEAADRVEVAVIEDTQTAPIEAKVEDHLTIEETSPTKEIEATPEITQPEAEVVAASDVSQEESPILQRIPPLASSVEETIEPDCDKVTELNAFEKQSSNKDPIDELFDNIDHLVKSKGVSKGMGFLKSRDYYKS